MLLHLSDLHLSTNVAQFWRAFGDREGDLHRFAGGLLPLLAPQAAVLSGKGLRAWLAPAAAAPTLHAGRGCGSLWQKA